MATPDAALPVVVIGAGPQGLAVAAQLAERGLTPLVLEQGTGPAAAVAEWGHVRLFSAWPELIDAAAERLLTRDPTRPWRRPDASYPTGREWIDSYLAPLATTLGDHIRYNTHVTAVARSGRDLVIDADRASQPFAVHTVTPTGDEHRIAARAVIDASGTWRSPNPAGAEGAFAPGERAAVTDGLVTSRIPTPGETARLAGRHVVVVGAGHSAATAIVALADVASSTPGTRITWLLRRGSVGDTFGGGDADELPARGALGARAKSAVGAGNVRLVTGFGIERFERTHDQLSLTAGDGRRIENVDHVLALTGFRPDLSFLSEVRLDLDPSTQAVRAIAKDVDPNKHSCGTVRATGAADLVQPEAGVFIIGAKSYGRAPTFLAMTGYEQARSVAAELAGDHEAARRVGLNLPSTGVCGGSGLFDGPATDQNACCAPASARVEVETPLRAR